VSAALTGLLLLAVAQAPPLFRSGVELVYVDVSVTRKDAPVRNLAAEDFVVTDNGVRQRVEIVDRDSTPTTAVLALDLSGSVAGVPLAGLRAAARAFLSRMSPRDEAALVTFNHEIELRQAPTLERRAITDALEHAEAGGSTAVIDALYFCLKRRWGGARSLVVLFTDGQDSASWLANDDVLQAARESQTLLYIIGTPQSTGKRFELSPIGRGTRVVDFEPDHVYLMHQIAHLTGGAYWSTSLDRLERVFLRVLEAADGRYLLSYEPEGVARSGRHKLKVSVRRKGVEVRARREYVVPGVAER
jgi:VWFA-related protein